MICRETEKGTGNEGMKGGKGKYRPRTYVRSYRITMGNGREILATNLRS